MITALETGCRLVLMVTLLALVAMFAAFQLGRPAGRATTSGAQVDPQDAPRIRTVQPVGTLGGRMAERTTMVAGPLPHGTPDARRSRQGDMPGSETVA
jgi:hypothetical protein